MVYNRCMDHYGFGLIYGGIQHHVIRMPIPSHSVVCVIRCDGGIHHTPQQSDSGCTPKCTTDMLE